MKIACPDIESLLAEFAADELDTATAERVAGHLAGCAECRAELSRELALRATLGGLPVQSGPEILPTVGDPGPRTWFARRRRWWPLAGSLAAAVLAVALFLPVERGDVPAPLPAADVAAIRRDARASLALTARILERSERHTVVDVFGRQIPAAIRESLPAAAVTPEGGQG